MARPVRTINNYVTPFYAESGRWSKQTQFKVDVIEYCDSLQANSTQNTGTFSARSAKVIIIGAPGVGKTSLLLRYCHDIFERNYKSTIGVDFEVEKCSVLGIPVNLQLWDTAGAERFRGVTTPYFRGANAVVLVFDLNACLETLEKTREWLYEANEKCANDFELFLVGTKKDMLSDVTDAQKIAVDYAVEYSAELWMTSAKTGQNVSDLFNRITITTFENLIQKEISSLKKIELAHNVIEKSTLIRVHVNDENNTKKRTPIDCCSR